ncbi:MAG: aromatic acid decarboxylase [Desulfuromonas sp.]|nr:MAG: aromatic acid decarboxylase [Desulfuromonas sp.]
MEHVVVAITGASGSIYGLRLVEELLKQPLRVTLLISTAGRQVLAHEVGLQLAAEPHERLLQLRTYFEAGEELQHSAEDDFFAPVASGSSAPDAMVVAPCSMGTAARIAAGLSQALIERVADVALKERRPLLLVPRETPLSLIHLENLTRLTRAGAQVLPAMPAFYQQPQSVAEMVDFVVGKVLDALQLPHELFKRWGETPADESES